MARVKRGNVARKRRNKILRLARGFRGGNGSLFRTANQRVMKALCNAYRDRRRRKRDFRRLWIARINAAARLTMKRRKCERITPHLKALKWLPVRQRIDFKVAVTTYRCLNNNAPPYLSKLLKKSSRDRRTAYSSDVLVPKTKTRLGDRAFSFRRRPQPSGTH